MGDAGYTLNNIVHRLDRERKMGSTNRTGWSSPATDAMSDAALTERDATKRLDMLRSAGRDALAARAVLPLFSAPVILASRATIRYDVGESGSSEMTSAMRAHLK